MKITECGVGVEAGMLMRVIEIVREIACVIGVGVTTATVAQIGTDANRGEEMLQTMNAEAETRGEETKQKV